MGRPREHDESTRVALLDAAERLLAQGGPEAVSVRDVAEACATTTRAVYSVFGSKSALVGALATRGYQRLAELVRSVPTTEDPAADLVAAGLGAFRAFAIERPYLFRVTFADLTVETFDQPGAREAAGGALEALATRVRRAQEAGALVDRSVLEIAYGFHALCHGLAANELLRQPPPIGVHLWRSLDGVDPVALWRATLAAYVDGLRVGARP